MRQIPRQASIDFRLSSAELRLEVPIRLCRLNGRWLAVADFDDEAEAGIGATPREALTGALSTLDRRAAAALMADPSLFGVSVAIRRPA